LVSVSRAIGVKHAATATADPEDEPPVLCQAQANEQQGERAREEDLRERIAAETRQNSNSPSAIALMHDTRMVSLGTRSPSRPHGARFGTSDSFSPRVDTLDSRATGDRHIPRETGEQR